MGVRGPLIVLLVAVVVGVLYAVPGGVAVVLHPLLGHFSHGTSSGKIYLLLGYVAAFALCWAWAARRGTARPPGRSAWTLLGVVVGIGLAGSLASFLLYTRAHGLSAAESTMHWSGGFNSSNTITHIHTSKTAIARALEVFELSRLNERFDTGAVYTRDVPAWLGWLVGAAFVTAIVQSLRVGARQAAAGSMGWSRGLVLALAMGSVCKCILDGGPLAYDCVAGLVAVWVIADGSATGAAEWLRRRWAWAVIAVGGWCLAMIISGTGTFHFQLVNIAERAALYGSIVVLGAVCSARGLEWSRARGGNRLGVVLGCVSLAVTGLAAWRTVSERVLPLNRGPEGRVVHYPVDGGALPRADQPPRSMGSLAEVYRAFGERPHRVKWTSTLAGTSEVATGFFAEVIVIDGPDVRPSVSRDGIVRVSVAEHGDSSEAPQRGRSTLRVNFVGPAAPVLFREGTHTQADENEKFVAYRLFDAHLREQGIREYVMIPYTAFRGLKPTGDAARGSSLGCAGVCSCGEGRTGLTLLMGRRRSR
jgi:hypothetical protein